jgi:hypothetical protein
LILCFPIRSADQLVTAVATWVSRRPSRPDRAGARTGLSTGASCKQCGHRVTEYSRKIGTSVCGIVTPKERPKRIRLTLWIGVVEIDRAVVGIGTNSCPPMVA